MSNGIVWRILWLWAGCPGILQVSGQCSWSRVNAIQKEGYRMTQEDWNVAQRIIASLAHDPALKDKCLAVLADYQRKRMNEQKDKAA